MKKFLTLLLVVMLSLGCVSAVAEGASSSLQELYSAAELLMVQGDYMGAAEKFEALATYSDASQMAMYCKAIAVAEMGMYSTAVEALNKLGDFKDCKQLAQYYAARHSEDVAANVNIESANDDELHTVKAIYEDAVKNFSDLALYKDSLTHLTACQDAIAAIEKELKTRAAQAAADAQVQMEAQYQQALALEEAGDFEGAVAIYETLGDYKDCKERFAIYQQYQKAVAFEESNDYINAVITYDSLGDYNDSIERISAIKHQKCGHWALQLPSKENACLIVEGMYSDATTSNGVLLAQLTKCENDISISLYTDSGAPLFDSSSNTKEYNVHIISPGGYEYDFTPTMEGVDNRIVFSAEEGTQFDNLCLLGLGDEGTVQLEITVKGENGIKYQFSFGDQKGYNQVWLELSNPSAESQAKSIGLNEGVRVKHKEYGAGTVIKAYTSYLHFSPFKAGCATIIKVQFGNETVDYELSSAKENLSIQ